jgi:hypothetical protein
LNLAVDFTDLELEKRLSTGVGRSRANLDVLLTMSDGTILGIESKLCEPYISAASKATLHAKYFVNGRTRWADVGLPGCQTIAESLRTGQHTFKMLDVAQLLKHMLALARTANPWSLCCVWFDVPGPAASQHHAELAAFAARLDDDAVRFSALTYQRLFARLVPQLGETDADYAAYFRHRYIGD